MRSVQREIQFRHFHKADPAYGEGVAVGLGIEMADVLNGITVAG